MIPVFLLLARESVKGKGPEWKRHVVIAGKRQGRLRYGLYIHLSFPLVSLVSERVCERENFPSVMRLRSES